jgi:hypothetical protein
MITGILIRLSRVPVFIGVLFFASVSVGGWGDSGDYDIMILSLLGIALLFALTIHLLSDGKYYLKLIGVSLGLYEMREPVEEGEEEQTGLSENGEHPVT